MLCVAKLWRYVHAELLLMSLCDFGVVLLFIFTLVSCQLIPVMSDSLSFVCLDWAINFFLSCLKASELLRRIPQQTKRSVHFKHSILFLSISSCSRLCFHVPHCCIVGRSSPSLTAEKKHTLRNLNVLITWPSSNRTWCFIQTRYRTLNEWFMTVLLAHRYHCMLERRNCLLTYRPVAWDITWIHARIIRTLQSTFISRTFLKLSRTVCPRRHTTQVEYIRLFAIAYDRLILAEKLVANAKLEGNLLLNRWSVKHLTWNSL